MLDDFTAAFQAEKRTLTFCLLALAAPIVVAAPKIEGCPAFPADSAWNIGIDSLPRHPDSDAFVATMGASRGVHPDFGTVYQGAPIGIPYVAVAGTQPKVAVAFDYGDESDAGPYPIPANPPSSTSFFRPIPRAMEPGARVRARSTRCDRTSCAPTAGLPRTPPACRSCPAWCATTRSPRERSPTHCASPPHRPGTPISGRRATTLRASARRSIRQWGCACDCAAASTSAVSRRRCR